MSISTTPLPAPPKKRGLGCLGCGCLVLALLVILVLGLASGGTYLIYSKLVSLTTPAPAPIPSFNGSDDLYNTAQQKIDAFQHDVENHQAATIQLSADEINTVIARNPGLTTHNAHLFVTLTNDQAQLQGSVPTDVLFHGWLNGRYLNFDATFALGFNSDARSVDLMLHRLQIGDQAAPEKLMPTLQAEFTPLLNAELQKQPGTKHLLQQAKSIEIKDGQLVIETQ